MKFRLPTNRLSGMALPLVLIALAARAPLAHAADAALAGFPPDVAQAMEAEHAAAAAAGEAGKRQTYVREGGSERRFEVDRSIHCLQPGSAVPPLTQLAQSADARKCWIQWTDTRTQVFNLYAAAAKAGPVPADILAAVNHAEATLPPGIAGKTTESAAAAASAAVNPLNGWDAKIEHSASGNLLSYSDSGGTAHHYAVSRPKFAQGIVQGDLGGWMYLAPDHKSGIMFTLGANGGVTGKPANPMMLQMMAGQ